ncbi:MAG: sensor histidine kinase [Chloroflexi bacterium]|nr:MAG: sensor histidine kinase [Chloroflexota bacterium]
MQNAVLGDVPRVRVGRFERVGRLLMRVLDILPRAPALGPVQYRPALVAFVGAVAAVGAVVAALTVRAPSDWATLGVGFAVAFGEAAYAIRPLPAMQTLWTPTVFVQLGLSLILGPAGAVAGAVGETLGFGVRTRNGWFRSVFNAANIMLSNLAAWWVFVQIAGPAHRNTVVDLLAGLCAGACHFAINHGMLITVVRLANPQVPITTALRSEFSAFPYSLGYGLAAFAFVVMHRQAGVAGFIALLMPVFLLHGFLINFARRVHAFDEQRAAYQKEREELLQKAVEASETERRRIARDLHDGVVQNLAGSAFALAAKAAELKSNGEQADAEILELMEHSAQETRAAMKDLRTLIIELAPPTLRREGLHAALVEILSTLKRKGTNTTLDLPPNLRLREDRAALIFRVAQEILRNVAAHAQARNVTVELKRDGGMAVLRIVDDGKGFTPRQVQRRRAQGHLGTAAIAELAEEADGSLEIDTEPGKGTRVTLRVPVE